MTRTHLLALTGTFGIYFGLAVSYYGWGRCGDFLLGADKKSKSCPTLYIWMGWAISLFILQLLHLVFPLNLYVVLPVLVLGIIFSIPHFAKITESSPRFSVIKKVLLLCFCIAALGVLYWISSRSMLAPTNYDSGLYHFNKIRWINTYPVVPGLGNLHGRLAFNQSMQTFVAALNFYPFFGHGYSIANSFLFLLVLATFLDTLRPVCIDYTLLLEAHPFRYASVIILFPVLGYLAFSSDGLFSPSPDLTSILLQLTIFLVFMQGVGEWVSGNTDQTFRVKFLAIMATTAVTVKLSNLAFAAVIMVFVPLYAIKPHARRVVIRSLAVSSIIVVVWCVHGVILSGAPLYPSTIGHLPVDWAISERAMENQVKWIYSWARMPRTHWSNVLGSWNWLQPWVGGMAKNYTQVVYPLKAAVLFFLLTCTALLARSCKKRMKVRFLEWLILLPSIAGLLYWFFTAPDIRFAHALIFIFPASFALLFLSSVQSMLKKQVFAVFILAVFLIANFHLFQYFKEYKWVLDVRSVTGWQPIRDVHMVPKKTRSGLTVYKPEKGNQSWDSPLPSTPYFNHRLELRDPDDLSSGFKGLRAGRK